MTEKSLIAAQPSFVFDGAWYLERNYDVRNASAHPLMHYLSYGWKEGRDPHPLFSTNWYFSHVQASGVEGTSALLHFLRAADQNAIAPHPVFDPDFYAGEVARAGGTIGPEPLRHFLAAVRTGTAGQPHPLTRLVPADPLTAAGSGSVQGAGWRQAIIAHPLFDAAWYAETYADVAASGMDPFLHFLRYGADEGRNPNPLFDTAWYRSENMLLDQYDINPLTHYILRGAEAGVPPCPVFNAQRYIDHYGLAVEPGQALEYYLVEGRRLGHAVTSSRSSLGTESSSREPAFKKGGKPLLIEISYDRTASPKSIGQSEDSRQIALAFESIQIIDASSSEMIAEVVFSNETGNARDYILFGFSHLEGWGAWSLGGRSALIFWLDRIPDGPLSVRMNAVAFRALGAVKLDVMASNGYSAGLRFKEATTVELDERPLDTSGVFVNFLQENVDARRAVAPAAQERPKVSIIILNFDRAQLSLLSALSVLHAASGTIDFELIIADNGSAPGEVQILRESPLDFRLVELTCNRYFGEGNNLGFEQARGEFVLFLNNDAFLTKGLVDSLLDALTSDESIGAVGPCFYYPDGRLQEAGALVAADGVAVQRGKNDPAFDWARLPDVDTCDYVSAACVMLRAEHFRAIGGFNYRFDPAYYEDTDLCFRLLLLGKRTCVVKNARCLHIESATTSDPRRSNVSRSVVENNRETFLSVWGAYLKSRDRRDLPHHLFAAPQSQQLPAPDAVAAGVYTPYPLTVGGGERYILSTAMAISEKEPSAVITPDAYSDLRLANVMFDLGLTQHNLRSRPLSAFGPGALETLVVMGNELFPPIALGVANEFFHCQFPFPKDGDYTWIEVVDGKKRLSAMRGVIVNSKFTAAAYRKAAEDVDASLPVHVCFPPVDTGPLVDLDVPDRRKVVLSIGRFTERGHSKRQDVLIDALAKTSARFRQEWRLVLCGSVPADMSSRDYLAKLRKAAAGLPVDFVLSPSRQALLELLASSRVYAHATGFGVTEPADYHLCEHFGITLVEAMAAGCTCISYAVGGPPEIFEMVGSGETYRTVDELAACLERADDKPVTRDVRHTVAKLFSQSAFSARMQRILYAIA